MDGVGIEQEEPSPKRQRSDDDGDDDVFELPDAVGREYRIHRMLDPANPDGKHYVRYDPTAGQNKFKDSYVAPIST